MIFKESLVADAMYFINVDRAHVSPIGNIRFFPRQSVEKSFRWKQRERNWQNALLYGVWIGLVYGNLRCSRPLLHDTLSLLHFFPGVFYPFSVSYPLAITLYMPINKVR